MIGKRVIAAFVMAAVMYTAAGCAGGNETPAPSAAPIETAAATETVAPVETAASVATVAPVETLPPVETPAPVTYSAAEARLFGDLTIMPDGGVGRFEQKNPADLLEFTVEIESEGFYQLGFEALTFGGFKENNLIIDGEGAGVLACDSEDYDAATVKRVYFSRGEHTVGLTANWGWIAVKSLTIQAQEPPDAAVYDVPATLTNAKADDSAKRLMSFLADSYGKTCLSGQQSQGDWKIDNGLFGGEAEFIFQKTGKRPAVIGLDMIDYSPSRVAKGSRSLEVEQAITAWESNAIVTFCWHWNAPAQYITGNWGGGFYTENTRPGFFKEIMSGKDKEGGYQSILDDIDAIAVQLGRLRDAGVPVLWRPLHEASGGWFWWGTDRESYLKLYKLLYERLTYFHGLNNLIWVWNGQAADWYPGDELVDIIGEDIYPGERVHASQVNKFAEAVNYTAEPKMVVLSENGCLFDPELAKRDGAMWGWWCVWNGEFTRGEKFNTFDTLVKVYNSGLVTTWADLPDLKSYPIRGSE